MPHLSTSGMVTLPPPGVPPPAKGTIKASCDSRVRTVLGLIWGLIWRIREYQSPVPQLRGEEDTG